MASMDSVVCSQCTYEGLRPHSDEPITLCPECGTAGTVWVNGKPPWASSLQESMAKRGAIEPEPDNHLVSTGIKISRYLLHRVQVAADERCLGRNLLIRMFIEQGLDRLIPIEQLTKEKEKEHEPEEAGNQHDHGRFGSYRSGIGVYTPTPKSPPQPTGSTSSVPGGVDRPDPEGFGVCLDLSCPSDPPATDLPAEERRDAAGRLDQPG